MNYGIKKCVLRGITLLGVGLVLDGVAVFAVPTDASMEIWFEQPAIAGTHCITDPAALRYVAEKALAHMRMKMAKDEDWGQKAALSSVIDPVQVAQTLAFVVKTIDTDTRLGRAQRILSPDFLQRNFDFLAWDGGTQTGPGTVRLTHYALFHAKGSSVKTRQYSCPLYELLDKNVRTLFTRHQIITQHRFEAPEFRGKVRALAWVTPDDFKQALMQGAIVLDFPDGQQHTFVVGRDNLEPNSRRHNGKDHYFFFGHKKHERGFGAVSGNIDYTSGIVLAADIDLFGYGKLVLLSYSEQWTRRKVTRLAIVADTGAAFTGRPDKLDLFVGYASGRLALLNKVKTIPDFAHARIAVYKPQD